MVSKYIMVFIAPTFFHLFVVCHSSSKNIEHQRILISDLIYLKLKKKKKKKDFLLLKDLVVILS